MAHHYRTLQHWNQWLMQPALGARLLQSEQELLRSLLQRHLGKHAILIGVPHQYNLLSAISFPCHTLIGPLIDKEKHLNYIEGDFYEVPIMTGSVDIVVLPHTLEFVDNPRQLLSEACRIIKPEGLIIITGFNPYSAWGIKKILANHKSVPWSGSFLHTQKIKNWLQLADFQIEQHQATMFRPPVVNSKIYEKMNFLESIGRTCFPLLGGVYGVVARAKVIPLTPIRMKWKQQINNIRISSTISGQIARHAK